MPDIINSYAAGSIGFANLDNETMRYVDKAITSTQMDTLNATPVELVAAPGSGYITEFMGAFCFNDFGGTAFELGSGTVDIKYTDGSGTSVCSMTNAFIESGADAYFHAYSRDVVMVANAALVLHASADVTAGNGALYLRVYYRTVKIQDVIIVT